MISLYLIFLGLIVSMSAKTRPRFMIGAELQMLGVILLALEYSSIAPMLATLAVLMIVIEAMKVSAAVGVY